MPVMPNALALLVGDPPSVWEDLGFSVTPVADGVGEAGAAGAVAWVGGVALVLGGELKGIRAWSLDGIDGIVCFEPPAIAPPDPLATVAHPNGVVALDHIVLATPDLERTIASLEAAGYPLRRRRDAGTTYDRPLQQAFFRVGPTILEVIGSPNAPASPPPSVATTPTNSTTPSPPPTESVPIGVDSTSIRRQSAAKGAPRFFGLALTVVDLEATAAFFGDRLHPAKGAVQPGRRIATLDRGAGSTVALAFMSAEPTKATGAAAATEVPG